MNKSEPSYQELSQELDTIIASLQNDDTDIDAALKQYERGLEITKALEAYLKNATNKLQTLTADAEK